MKKNQTTHMLDPYSSKTLGLSKPPFQSQSQTKIAVTALQDYSANYLNKSPSMKDSASSIMRQYRQQL